MDIGQSHFTASRWGTLYGAKTLTINYIKVWWYRRYTKLRKLCLLLWHKITSDYRVNGYIQQQWFPSLSCMSSQSSPVLSQRSMQHLQQTGVAMFHT